MNQIMGGLIEEFECRLSLDPETSSIFSLDGSSRSNMSSGSVRSSIGSSTGSSDSGGRLADETSGYY